ncbi:MAG TPA: hypothetical protein VFI11_05430 [Anaerolineales bacterium]|nr:hypothetical protein [Anaerolineales bacterium]
MKGSFALLLAFFSLLLASCGGRPVCPPDTGTPFPTITPLPSSVPFQLDIGSKTISVDRLVDGLLCDDRWSGTVYVACDVQVKTWEEHPTFLKDCDLSIAPGSVVYVAYHNNEAYYNGCSCHMGETAEP